MKKITVALSCFIFLSVNPSHLFAQVNVGVSISANIAPPPLPVYTQPPCPVDGFLWTPGYWAYGDMGYYWVSGVWVRPPHFGFLWTPSYWGFAGGVYGWHAGYWGPHVGFYGGVNYGFGYGGVGFGGGMWRGGVFRYNTAVMNVNTTIVHNTYVDRTVINNTTINNHTSFNGPGGISARPRPEDEVAMRENHVQATSEQMNHERTASMDRNQFASVNHGRPKTTAMNRVNGKRFDESGQKRNNENAERRPYNANHPNRGTANRRVQKIHSQRNNPHHSKEEH